MVPCAIFRREQNGYFSSQFPEVIDRMSQYRFNLGVAEVQQVRSKNSHQPVYYDAYFELYLKLFVSVQFRVHPPLLSQSFFRTNPHSWSELCRAVWDCSAADCTLLELSSLSCTPNTHRLALGILGS